MRRPDFMTAFLSLLAGFNVLVVVLNACGLIRLTPDEVGFYAGVAMGCSGALLVLRLRARRGRRALETMSGEEGDSA